MDPEASMKANRLKSYILSSTDGMSESFIKKLSPDGTLNEIQNFSLVNWRWFLEEKEKSININIEWFLSKMTSISVISPSVDKDSVPTLSTMIDPETSINNLVDHAAAHQKLGTVKFILVSLSQTKNV